MKRHVQTSWDPLKIVALGGGNGLSTLLHGVKDRMDCAGGACPSLDLAAVVTVADDGGSSGRLRRDFDILPPGDIRNCLVALSQDEALLAQLFQYRFTNGRGLKGHTLGNLLLTALSDLTGDFASAVKHASDVLATCGRIYPSTTANVTLEAVLVDGSIVKGETRIGKSKKRIATVRLTPSRCKALPEVLDAIAQADVISLGPGSLFTSVIPNLLVPEIRTALRTSRALKVYFCNLMWQPGETTGFKASDHVSAIHRHARGKLVDVVVLNTSPISPTARRSYAARKAEPVENDLARLHALGVHIVEKRLAAKGAKIRHDPGALADVLIHLAGEGRRRATGRQASVVPFPAPASIGVATAI
jgi:uncharacterized cofD-like protein